MTPQELAQVKKTILSASVYYGRSVTIDVVDMYASLLEDLSFQDVMSAIKTYMMEGRNKFMFNAANLRDIIAPEPKDDDVAREIASRITQSLTSYGWCNGESARKYIGEVGWEIVRRRGGWMNLCQNHGVTIDPGMFEAQARELAKVQIASSQNPAFGSALQIASYGGLKLVPQNQTLDEIEDRKIKLLEQINELNKEGKK